MNNGNSGVTKPMNALAGMLAIIVAFFATGPAFHASKDDIYTFAVQHYGAWSADIALLAWAVSCGLIIFFLARAVLSIALTFLTVKLITRTF